jgi:two-component system NtrC family sensor kinase
LGCALSSTACKTSSSYVINEWFITRYVPLRDHLGQVVGSLYVGARRAMFIELQRTLQTNIILVALVAIVPVAQGNTQVRIPNRDVGEVAVLGQAFNTMVAELEETQAQLIRKEKLASIGQLAAGVAHHLNNPLGTILLFSDILLQDMPEGTDGSEDVQMIAREARRAKEIVTALLNFARQQKVWAQPTALDTLLHELIESTRQQPAYDPIQIEADPAQLPNIFVNLMDNAADAMPDGGTLTIQADRRELSRQS